MSAIFSCIADSHDARLLILASIVCIIGIYGSSSVATHAGRSLGQARIGWAAIAIVAAGCTAWATHMIGLLAFNPGMASGFDPLLTATSLVVGIVGIGAGVAWGVGRRDRRQRFLTGVVLGLGVVALHYIGQASYVVTGYVEWDWPLVLFSIGGSLFVFGMSMVAFADRSRIVRRTGAPLLVLAIAVLHFSGMKAARLVFDPRYELPAQAISPRTIAPVVAIVSLGLLALAVLGLRFTLAAKAAVRRDHERLRELASLAVEGLAICTKSSIATANQSLEKLCGSLEGQLSGRMLEDVLPGIDLAVLPEGEERDAQLVATDGSILPVRVIQRQINLGGKTHTAVAVRDQRERLTTEAEIRRLAFSDALTGLPNRARFSELLATHAAMSRSHGAAVSVLLVDLDRFKQVNDTLGPAAADALLKDVSKRLTENLNDCDIAARIGRGEFAILLIDRAEQRDAVERAERLVEQINQTYCVCGQHVHVGASVGIAFAPDQSSDPETLMRNAGLALRKAKSDGRNKVRVFEASLAQQAQDRQQLEADLRDALLQDQLTVHFQPLVSSASRRIVAAEALVRWKHPTRGMISPADFIPMAEETGLIGDLGRFVLQTACRHATTWPDHIRLAVNLSPTQIRDPHLLESALNALASAGLSSHRLELEVTEGVLLLDEEHTLKTLNALRSRGISLSIDDFGTGYSSLSYLRRFPFSKVKIDQSFVRNLPDDAESAAIVRAIVALAGALRMSTTVEGVETSEQFAFVAAEGCDQIQGFYVSRPVPAHELELLLQDQDQAAAA